MAKINRTDIYEGDDDTIDAVPFPTERETGTGRPYEGETARQNAENKPVSDRNRRSAGNSGLFDDFDRHETESFVSHGKRYKKELRHKGLWIFLIVFNLSLIFALVLFMLPQLTGMRYRFLPNFAFANGSIIQLDSGREEVFAANRDAIYKDTLERDGLFRGIYIDNLSMENKNRETAVAALESNSQISDTRFNITVTVGNQSWHVTPERVPVTRNITETVAKAWALGRKTTAAGREKGLTAFEERVRNAEDLLSFPVSLYTEETYDHEALMTLCEGIANYVNSEPINSMVSTFDFTTRTFTFTDDIPGAKLDAMTIYNGITEALDTGNYFTSLHFVPEKILAPVTRTELMNSFGLISSYTTNTTNNKNRNTNISLSARAINGRTVLPGELFSFNDATGERTTAKGYKEAAAISGGQSKDEVGGGVCQTSSTLFNAVARADLEILARSPHAWPSSYVEKGFDATVDWPSLDFKFRNNTEWPVFIVAEYENKKVTVSIYGMSPGSDVKIDLESVTVREIPQPEGTEYVINTDLKPGESNKTVTGRKGYVVETWKVWYQGGVEIKREKMFTTTYKAYQEKVEYNPR